MPDYVLALAVHTHPSGASVLSLTGELDYHTAPRLCRTVEKLSLDAATPLVLEVSSLLFCDSIGVTALLFAYRHALAASAPFAVAGAGKDLAQIFEITGIDRLFDLHEDVDRALAAIG
ncbi:STAS domain-containing protein [Kitasatospora sp. NPDC049258]|uniref:STAS domain-containing protein n=1 Tax=Kitasatospora sp. NPDC049258 TaxID=3155394 RepID=UPI003413D976